METLYPKTNKQDLILSFFFSKRQVVYLHKSNIEDEDIHFLSSQDTSKTVKLILGVNKVSELGIISLRLCKWPSLTIIYLSQNQIKNNGCKYLARIDFPVLARLFLGNNQISSEGVLHLSKASLAKLKQLNLDFNKITSDSIRFIIKSNYPYLDILSIQSNSITAPQFMNLALQRSRISELVVKKNLIDQTEGRKLQNKFTRIRQVLI